MTGREKPVVSPVEAAPGPWYCEQPIIRHYSLERINEQLSRLKADLQKRNDLFDAGNVHALDDLHEKFTVDINGITVSLGSMDTYGKFVNFMQSAALDYEE